jgi:hypothetical protein
LASSTEGKFNKEASEEAAEITAAITGTQPSAVTAKD